MFTASVLTVALVEKLRANLHETEVGRHIMLDLKPIKPEGKSGVEAFEIKFFNARLTPMNDGGKMLLEASMKDGMLHHWGWDKLFTRTES